MGRISLGLVEKGTLESGSRSSENFRRRKNCHPYLLNSFINDEFDIDTTLFKSFVGVLLVFTLYYSEIR